MNGSKKLKFYEKAWFLWAMLFFIAPIGIAMLWIKNKYSQNMRDALGTEHNVIKLRKLFCLVI